MWESPASGCFWRALAATYEDRLPEFDFDALAVRADTQQQRLEACRLDAIAIAFGAVGVARTAGGR